MRKLIAAIAISVLLILAGCNGKPNESTNRVPNPPFEGSLPEDVYVTKNPPGFYGGQMVLDLPTEPRTLNVIRATDEYSTGLLWYHHFRCLVDLRNGDAKPDYDPGLCKKYESSADAKEWTFYLRKGIKWSDGEPFTADDVLFTYEVTTADPNKIDTAARDIFIEGEDENGNPLFPKLEKIDDHTVRFKLNSPNSGFLTSIFNLYLIPKHKWEQSWKEGTFRERMGVNEDPANMVGLGPFRLKEYVPSQRVVLERNPYFWKVDSKNQRLPYLDRLVFVITKDFNTIQSKFESGEIDVMSRVQASDYARVQGLASDNVTVVDLGATLDTRYFTFNRNNYSDPRTGKPYVAPWKQKLFRDQKFRQAISYAIDREGLINTVFFGRGEPLYSFVSTGDKLWYTDDIMKYPYNPGRAKELLAEIGLKDTNGDGILEDTEGHPVEFTINTNNNNPLRVQTVAFLAQKFKDVGIKANSAPLLMNDVLEMLQSTFNFDAIALAFVGGVPPDPINSKNILLSSGLNHASFPLQKTPSTEWEAEIDDLVRKIEMTIDLEERKRMYARIQRIWSEQLPEIYLVSEKEAVAYRTKFANIQPSVMRPRLTWNVEEIYLK
jgi:peptide/nickel transport system substrate-binding protein